jgi:nitrite reductase/ring-hydroxylating ferredoxin subunit
MLTAEDNNLLCRVGRGTPMGEALRQYWLPCLPSAELTDRDGEPVRVRLLGEDLIAFRDSDGKAGLIQNACPHRGASLFFGRNEEAGLRCVYHGWKFDISGACVDMPNEPAESNFKHKIKAAAYPTRERNGVIWAYMGPLAEPPELPFLEWNLVPENQVQISIRYQECNWVQAVEGGIDSSHVSFLHRWFGDEANARGEGNMYRAKDSQPRFEVADTSYGVLIGACRDASDDSYYWRITQFLMPFYTMIPPQGADPAVGGHAWVPMDDETTATWTIGWHPTRPIVETNRNRNLNQTMDLVREYNLDPNVAGVLPKTSKAGGAWRPVANPRNDYMLNQEIQRTKLFCGIVVGRTQDQAMQESMGPIYDRTKEHLGASDTAIIRVRRRWISAAKALKDDGTPPPGALEPEAYHVRSVSQVFKRNVIWTEAARALWQIKPGVPIHAV